MQAHKSKISHLHASALLDKHWPSTLHWVREWRFTSAWLNLNWNCEENEIKIAGIKHGERSKWERECQKWACAMTNDRAWSHRAEDWGELIQQSDVSRSSFLTDAALRDLKCLTYRFGRSWDVLDHHLPLGAQILLTQRRFAFLIQVHVLLKTQANWRKFQ